MEFIQSLIGDEFLSKAFVLSILTGTLVYLKNVPQAIWSRIKRLIIFTVTIEQTDELFDYTEKWLKDNHAKKYRNVLANINYRNFALENEDEYKEVSPNESSVEQKKTKEIVQYRHNQDVVFIKENNIFIKIDKGRDKLENARTFKDLYFDKYNISTFFFKKRIQLFLDEIVKYNQQFKKEDNNIHVHMFDGYSDWRKIRMLTPKKIDDIVLDNKIKANILSDAELFVKRKEWYIKRGIPYKRGYLFYGSPGNGKTSFSLALASYLRRDIYPITISEVKGDDSLRRLFNNVKSNGILLLEDIDSLFIQRKSKDHISFSTLLNCLDGIYYKEGLIVIMTTNYIDKLDEALIRDGRIDLRVSFTTPKEQQVKEYIELFYDIKINGLSYKNQNYSMAKIQNYCLNHSIDGIKKLLFK